MKQFTFDTSNLPELQQDLHQIMMKNELRKGQDAFKLSHAGTKKSGYSFGPVQWDLANNEEARDHFIALMANAEPGTFTKGTLADMALELQTKGTRTETIETNRAKIDAILASRKGEQAIKEFYADSLQGLQGKVNDVIEAGRDNPNAKDFLESRQGRAMIGDWINQSGDPTQILNFVKGKDAELNGKIIKLESKLDVGEWQRYLYSTKYGAENPDDILRRLRNTIDTVPNEAAKPIETPAGDMKKSENEADSPHESHQAHADSPAETLIAQDRAQETERSQAARAFLDKIAQPFDKPALTIALRDPASWTADEAKSVMADYLSRQGNDPFLKQLSDLTGQHMKAIYGDGALKYDATGKMIDPKPIRPYAPAEETPRTPEGYPLDGAINWAAERVANRIDRHGIEKAISWLQGG